jgi:hypothetical protein
MTSPPLRQFFTLLFRQDGAFCGLKPRRLLSTRRADWDGYTDCEAKPAFGHIVSLWKSSLHFVSYLATPCRSMNYAAATPMQLVEVPSQLTWNYYSGVGLQHHNPKCSLTNVRASVHTEVGSFCSMCLFVDCL